MARLQDQYKSEIAAKLKAELQIGNPMAVPRLTKVVVSMGTGSPMIDKNAHVVVVKLVHEDELRVRGPGKEGKQGEEGRPRGAKHHGSSGTILSMGLLAQGCAFVSYPDQLGRVSHGATRSSIESGGIIGGQISSVASGKGKIVTYSYRKFDSNKCPHGDLLAIVTLTALAAPFICAQTGRVVITYGPNDTVEKYEIVKDSPIREANERRAAETERRLLERAMRGEAEAQNLLGARLLPKPEGMRWLCRAADQGHARARNDIAERYAYDLPPVRKDVVQAYLWHDLSAAAGFSPGAGRRDDLAENMTPAQIAKAKRLVKAWKPGQCETEVRKAKVGG